MISTDYTKHRQRLRLFAGMAFLGAGLFALIIPAAAKGPESVTITGPGVDPPLELITADNFKLVERLLQQSGIWFGTGDLPRPIEDPPGELGPSYTLTWINGGPPGKSVEARTIRQELYLEAEGGPIIHTPDQPSLDNWGPGVTGWFAAPSGLPDTLIELGVPIRTGNSFFGGILARVTGGIAWLERPSLGSVRLAMFLGLALTVLLLVAILARRMANANRSLPPPG